MNQSTTQPDATRQEHDLLGRRDLPAGALYGIHTLRAVESFPLSGRVVHAELIHAYGLVKLACAKVNRKLGQWSKQPAKADAIESACMEMSRGALDEYILVDALQGGAGTSTNMNVNEVLANRALQILDQPPGDHATVSPLDDINLHQSTNDTYPTALKLAAIGLLGKLESSIVALQEALQRKEKQFAHVVKVGRTELQDAVLTTLGREFGAWAEAVNRDRWRIYKCQERLRVINLGGTAIGSGIAAPRQYIFMAADELRQISGVNLARAENLCDATQNADVYVEVSGMLKAHATSLLKIANDLRLLASGPEAGLREIRLPPRQAGSSIMPGKINPVIPEAVCQVAMKVIANDSAITAACAAGNLELNPFLPLIADALLESLKVLAAVNRTFADLCINDIQANEEACRAHAHDSTAVLTSLLPALGYEKTSQLAQQAHALGITVRQTAITQGYLSEAEFLQLTSSESVCRLGHGHHGVTGGKGGEP